MAFVTAETALEMMLNSILLKAGGLTDGWELKLFSNNFTPGVGDEAGDYTEVTGGGYSDFTLDKAEFTVTPGSPAQAIYSDFLDFEFTGPTSAPTTIYGYFIIDGAGELIGAERFIPSFVPFVPVNGSLIRVKPQLLLNNLA